MWDAAAKSLASADAALEVPSPDRDIMREWIGCLSAVGQHEEVFMSPFISRAPGTISHGRILST
jgi:hypothetical protein